jgi:phage replication O-like protein O
MRAIKIKVLPIIYTQGNTNMISPIQAPTYFQTPNDVVDHWLPHLREAELKVLFVILRKTFGWHKQYDRISLSQFVKITGLKRTNAIRATNSLLSKGIITKEVVGKKGSLETYYSLVVIDNSNNSYRNRKDTTPSPGKGLAPSPGKGLPLVPEKDLQKKDLQKTIIKYKEKPLPNPDFIYIYFGKFVKLKEADYQNICNLYGKEKVDSIIEDIDNYCESSGKEYKNYLAAFNTFIKRQKSYHSQAKKPADIKQKLLEKGFKNGQIYTPEKGRYGYECYINEEQIAFQGEGQGNYKKINFKENGFWDQFDSLIRNLGIKSTEKRV